MRITHPDQLPKLRMSTGWDNIEVEADSFLDGNLPLYLFKYLIWALRKDGIAQVHVGRAIDSMVLIPCEWSLQFLVQGACKAIEGMGELVAVDLSNRRFSFRRTKTVFESAPWSAIVMFSGKEAELPLMENCIQSLRKQAPIESGGQIIVCGPADAAPLARSFEGVDYLPFETPIQAGRFLVGKKKNYAISQALNDRVLVCHSRIELQLNCLINMPLEFDVISPRVWMTNAAGKQIPYLDMMFLPTQSTSMFTRKPLGSIAYPREQWLKRLGSAYPYIDGALYCINKTLALAHPLSETIAWGEAEDVEWCHRLLSQGKILELNLNSDAISMTNKTNHYYKWGHIPGYCAASDLIRGTQVLLKRVFR